MDGVKDIALINPIDVVFPEAANLLCRFHINKNVKAKCKMIVHPRETREYVMKSWGAIFDCDNCWEKRVIFPLKQNPNRVTRQIILNKQS